MFPFICKILNSFKENISSNLRQLGYGLKKCFIKKLTKKKYFLNTEAKICEINE